MVYIYKKRIGEKDYYYLRISVKNNNKIVTKDLAYLGSDLSKISEKLDSLSSYQKEIRKAYKTINSFIQTNRYIENVQSQKIKTNSFLSKKDLYEVEACKLHWNQKIQKMDELTKSEILKNFIIEFAFNTASIEGNTITLKQAQNLLMENLTPKNKTLKEIYDLQNTQKVFLSLYDNLKQELNHKLISKVHDSLLENIDNRTGYRTDDVRVFKMNFKSTPAKYVKIDMDILLDWYEKNKRKLHPLVLATLFHHKFEKIHPFMDGNGRTGRMLMNFILLKNNYPPIIIRKKNRTEYLNKLNKADGCDLDKTENKYYDDLIEFTSFELKDNYWNLFL
ncbi:MAG: Fic family protein [Nanoarchaeota archaeon]|nr:Fic family protein [Nanoarchaeota archaeon]MBU1270161.1 Fic family protein [Nanoarchaeota archaeon]MBU1604744.1 Fic family protein [Nanoarchaeota archaeon]MBU2443173.1 Fic family protein [Nanoarchaeota archaeon]